MRESIVLVGAEVPSGRAVARRLRGEQFYCRLLPSGASAKDVLRTGACGVVLAGEQTEGAMAPDPNILGLGLPVLALGSPARALLDGLGARDDAPPLANSAVPVQYLGGALFAAVEPGERWIARADRYAPKAPYRVVAESDGFPLGFAEEQAHIYLLQFQIERNDPDGMAMLRAFAADVCHCTPWWTMENILAAITERIAQAAASGDAVCAISGGLDSTVAALLARRALGDRARCIFVDTGLLREGEADETERVVGEELGLTLTRVDASARVLAQLDGVADMDEKWRRIEREIGAALKQAIGDSGRPYILVKGTNYADTLMEQGALPLPTGAEGPGTVEPLRDLFKDEIHSLGELIEVPQTVLDRQPFPGIGLAARIGGMVTRERLALLRRADQIFSEEMQAAGCA